MRPGLILTKDSYPTQAMEVLQTLFLKYPF